tara:strand:+ start:1218 stop:1391 length:174 start_codon:yes stop_codon:yes gene_type:complete
MEITIATGQWIPAITDAILGATDGDTFLLPSNAHIHAFEIAKKITKSTKQFKVRVHK